MLSAGGGRGAFSAWLPAAYRAPSWAIDCALLVAFVLILSAPEWLGLVHADPRLINSGMAQGFTPGLTAGQGGFIDPNSAFTAADLGKLSAEDWLAGRMPWWNPYLGVGAPLAAEMQPASFFLPFVLLWHFDSGWLLLHMAMQCIAAAGMYALCRQLGLSRTAAVLGGALFACSGTLAWFSHGPERVAVFLPWIVFGLERARTRWSGAALLAVSLAYSILAGFPETAYLDGLLAAAWAALRMVETPPQGASRAGFALRTAAGGFTALLLTAPAVLPFAEYLASANVGGHGAMARAFMPPFAVALHFLPYLLGPLWSFQQIHDMWGGLGGYVGAAAGLLAIAGAAAGSRALGLRLLLVFWIVLVVVRLFGFGPSIDFWNALPLVSQTAFYRYITPSLSFAAIVLASIGVDAWQRGQTRALAPVVLIIGSALIVLCAWTCRGLVPVLWYRHLFRLFFCFSLLWSAALACALTMFFRASPRKAMVAALAGFILADAAGAYLAARVGSPLGGHIDAAPAIFLQKNAGLARSISAYGGIGLNEPARFGFADIDETMLPVPRLWSDYTRRHFGTDGIVLWPLYANGAALPKLLPVLQGLGVGWVTMAHGAGAGVLQTAPPDSPHTARDLPPGAAIGGTLPRGLAALADAGPGGLVRVGVDIGTYRGLSDGALRLTLTGGFGTASATAPLAGATDDAALDFTLDRAVPPTGAIGWRLEKIGGKQPVAIWLHGDAPRFSAVIPVPGAPSVPEFSGAGMDVFRLPGEAPYWDSACRIVPHGRERADADCAAASTLLRRELFFPGWRAVVNGAAVAIAQDGLFERIALPEGRSTVRFAYAPPRIVWAYAGFALGLAGLMLLAAGDTLIGRARRRPMG